MGLAVQAQKIERLMDDGKRSRALTAILLAIIVAGVIARFPNVENRVLWKDEAISVLRAAGYTEADFAGHFTDGRLHRVAEMRVYQGRNSSRSVSDVIASSAREDPQHPPLYVLLLFLWHRVFGTSIAADRGLSLLVGDSTAMADALEATADDYARSETAMAMLYRGAGGS